MEGAQVTYPPIVIENEIDHLMRDLEMRLSSQNLAFDDYLKIEGKNAEEIRNELKPAAEERVSRGLILGQVVEEENLEVDDEEVTQEIDRMLEPLGESGNDSLKEVFDTPEGRNRIGMDLLTKKAIDRLMDISKGEAEYEKPEDDHEESQEEQTDQEIKE